MQEIFHSTKFVLLYQYVSCITWDVIFLFKVNSIISHVVLEHA